MSDNPSLQDVLNHGSALIEAGRLEDAEKLSNQLLKTLGDNLEVRFFASDVESLRNDPLAAIRHLDALPEESAQHPRVLVRKAQLLLFDGQRENALACARRVDLSEADERLRISLARILMDTRQLAEARDCLLSAHAQSRAISYMLAIAEVQLDLLDDAEQHLEQVLGEVPGHAGALHLRSQLRQWTPEHNHIDELREVAAQANESQLTATANYALGKEYEDIGEHADAFAAFSAGAAAYRSLLSHQLDDELAAQQDIRDTFVTERFESLSPGHQESGPIFLVGMPRSGLRLADQILSKHSAVAAASEAHDFRRLLGVLAKEAPAALSDAEATLAIDFAELGRRYMEAVRQLTGEARYRVDRTSYNFLYCGHILAALPDARIIHMTRDPLDTCYSVFKTLYIGSHSYSYDLDEIAQYFISYRKQMAHWHSLFPGRILDVGYESLVTDPAQEARRMLDFCDLAFEGSVLETQAGPANPLSIANRLHPFHKESIGSARRAGQALDGLRARLEEAGIVRTAGDAGSQSGFRENSE